jgi:hypothetical protein
MEQMQEQRELYADPSHPKLSSGRQQQGPFQGDKIHHGIHLAMIFLTLDE